MIKNRLQKNATTSSFSLAKPLLFLLLLVFFPPLAFANDDFIVRMELYISEMNPNFETTTEIKNQDKIPVDCPFPIFNLQSKQRTWGNITVVAACDNKKHYLPVFVSAKGNVLIATETIQRGEPLGEYNTTLKSVDITHLSTQPIIDGSQMIEAQALRVIQADSVITLPMIKRAWVIRAGDIIEVTFSGEGFSAINSGKAINNGYLGDKVRIRLENKTIVEAIVTAPGKASLN